MTDQNDMPVAGVVLTLKQGGTKRLSTSSNILGQYLFSNVRPEPLTSKATTSYSIVVTKAGYSFGTNNVYTFDGNPNPVIAPDRSSQFIFQDVKGNKL